VIAAYSRQYSGICPNRLKIKHAQTGSAFPVTRRTTNSGTSDPKRGTLPPRLPVRTELVVKAKGQPLTGHESPVVEHSYSSTLSLTSALDGVGGQRTSRPFYPRETPGIHCTGGWVGSRTGLDGCGKSRPTHGFDPRTVQRVASCYTTD